MAKRIPGNPPPEPRSSTFLLAGIMLIIGAQSRISFFITSSEDFLEKMLWVLLKLIARLIKIFIFSFWLFVKFV